jgi:hypothetical protein
MLVHCATAGRLNEHGSAITRKTRSVKVETVAAG